MSRPLPPLDTLSDRLQTLAAAEHSGQCFDAIVVLPYTRVKRRCGPAPAYRMSHFTARCVLAGLELYQMGVGSYFILPGEQRGPATCDLEQKFLLSRGVAPERILNLPDRNGTLQQLEPVARLQQQSRLTHVVVVCFAFHAARVREYMSLLGIRGDIAEVEQTHAAFLRVRAGATRVNCEELLNLPQLHLVRHAEQGISRTLLRIDRLFGGWAPATRLFKLIAGPTVTDLERGQARVGLTRVVEAQALVRELEARVKRNLKRLGSRPG